MAIKLPYGIEELVQYAFRNKDAQQRAAPAAIAAAPATPPAKTPNENAKTIDRLLTLTE